MIPLYGTGQVFLTTSTQVPFWSHWLLSVRSATLKALRYIQSTLVANVPVGFLWKGTRRQRDERARAQAEI
jgi:hypothetical protein